MHTHICVCVRACVRACVCVINGKYGEWKLLKSQFSPLVSAVAVFKSLISKTSFYSRLFPS